MTELEQHLRVLVADLVAVKPTLRAEEIRPESSITEDLGFDSLDLVELANRVRDEYPGFDLRTWLAESMSNEVDSVESMAALLAASQVAEVAR